MDKKREHQRHGLSSLRLYIIMIATRRRCHSTPKDSLAGVRLVGTP